MANKPNMVKAAGNLLSTTLNGGINASDTTIVLTSGTGFDTGGGFIIIDEDNASKEIIYYESRSSNTLTVATNGRGQAGTTGVSHSSGATVTDVLVADHINLPRTAFLAQHNDDGTHGAITATTVSASTSVSTDTVSEKNADTGVTIDSVLMKDAEVTLNNNKSILGKESGGTARSLIKRNASEDTEVGDGVNEVVIKSMCTFRAHRTSNQSIPNGNTETQIQFNVEDWDTGADYNNSTYTFTAPRTGKYHVHLHASILSLEAGDDVQLRLKVGSTEVRRDAKPSEGGAIDHLQINDEISLTAADTVSAYILHNSSASRNLEGTSVSSWFTMRLVST